MQSHMCRLSEPLLQFALYCAGYFVGLSEGHVAIHAYVCLDGYVVAYAPSAQVVGFAYVGKLA